MCEGLKHVLHTCSKLQFVRWHPQRPFQFKHMVFPVLGLYGVCFPRASFCLCWGFAGAVKCAFRRNALVEPHAKPCSNCSLLYVVS